ncbi:hypothetical protein [Streptomyces sp. NPDC002133]|uniref:hypothetical protein n=1 Tax=Streptomyces sp. NPDC002133 TaxID=3154409 RepID=UPI0033320C08
MSWTSSRSAARRTGREPVTGVAVAAVRAATFGATSTGLAVTGHHLASGHPASWRAALFAGLLLFLLVLPAVRSLRSLTAVTAATAAAQYLLHLWLAGVSAHRPHPSHQAPVDSGSHETWHAGHHGAAMTAAHLAAAVLVAWLMQRADAACRSAGQRIGDTVAGLVGRLVPARPPQAVRHMRRPVRARALVCSPGSLVLAHSVVRRGPPVGTALAH